MTEVKHRHIETNGIKMHIAEAGTGPLVIMVHGFPELWYTWRNQLPALAEGGFHAVAPDMRGFGQTDRPQATNAYNILQLTGDIVGLVKEMGESQAIIIGHDWGSVVTQHCALLRPDIFKTVILLSIPYLGRLSGNTPPLEIIKKKYGEEVFYQIYFQEPGKAEADLEQDARRSMGVILYANSANPPPEKRWDIVTKKGEALLERYSYPDPLPAWLTEADIDYFGKEYARTGFRGGLNWYRNIDWNWRETPFLDGAKILQPAIYIVGETDPVMRMFNKGFDNLDNVMANLKKKVIVPGVGHWVNQENPAEVNRLILDFLKQKDE